MSAPNRNLGGTDNVLAIDHVDANPDFGAHNIDAGSFSISSVHAFGIRETEGSVPLLHDENAGDLSECFIDRRVDSFSDRK